MEVEVFGLLVKENFGILEFWQSCLGTELKIVFVLENRQTILTQKKAS